ncbi:MAG TPA: Hsp20/alpha crystallin family protein [Actinomycetes bacterium]|nr:Hsp20/alpha crystallin family protein [Actinomycetes bacterium]
MTTAVERAKGPEVTSWQPWTDLFPWNTRLTQALDALWHATPHGADFAPSDVFEETDDAFTIELDVPGIPKKDITIDVAGRRVTINGVRKETERSGVMRRSTRITGEFQYDLTLPAPVDETKVSATLAEGVLTVRLPKAQEEKPLRVTIT